MEVEHITAWVTIAFPVGIKMSWIELPLRRELVGSWRKYKEPGMDPVDRIPAPTYA